MNSVFPPGDYRPISLPRKDTVLIAALASLQGKYIALDVGPETWRLRFSGRPGLDAGPETTVSAKWQGHRIDARFPQVLLHRTLQLCQPGVSANDIPAPLWPALACNLIGAWLTRLPHVQSLRIDAIGPRAGEYVPDEPGAAPGDMREPMRLYLFAQRIFPNPADALEYAVALDLDPALLSALPRLCRDLPSGAHDSSIRFAGLSLPLRCEIGSAAVPYATLKALRLGDILFFDSHAEADGSDSSGIAMQLTHRDCPVLRTRLHSADLSFAPSFAPSSAVSSNLSSNPSSGLMVVTETNMNDRKSFFYDDLLDESDADLPGAGNAIHDFDERMSLDPAAALAMPSGRQAGDRLSQLPLQLVFDVGDCEMRLSELQALQVGSVIPLAANKTEMVRIRVNGHVVGSGDLVDIDGKIGVMLARLADMQ